MRRFAARWASSGAVFVALCVFIVLLASPGQSIEPNLWRVVPASMDEAIPKTKPDRNADPALPAGVSIARQCTASTMFSRVVDSDGTRIYYARYSRTAFNEMVAEGCTRVQQGCNTCTVTYSGCSEEDRAACTDGDCLERVCKRRMLCTSKRCTAYAHKAPPCEARFAKQVCLENAFHPLDSKALPRE